jgi:N-formylglutamate amidohydrolase
VSDEPSFEEIVRHHCVCQGLLRAAKQCERLTAYYDPYNENLSEEQKRIRHAVQHALRDAAAKIMELRFDKEAPK